MILAVDVDYRDEGAFVAGIAFHAWDDERGYGLYTSVLSVIEEYKPGEFYRRELPCILKLLEEHGLIPETIVIDGYVFLGGKGEGGMGKHLFDALQGRVNVVGVAKRPFKGVPTEWELVRGKSTKPLYVTSAGLPLDVAKSAIRSMHGSHRVPTLLKAADRACRQR